MSPIASEWLRRALKEAPEEMAKWPAWLRGSFQHQVSEPKPTTATDNQLQVKEQRDSNEKK